MSEGGSAPIGFGARWKWALIALAVANFLVGLRAIYFDPDPLLYAMIGEGIWKYGRWPFDYAFDHKPVLTYVAYGLVRFLPPNVYEFQIFSVVLAFITAILTRHILLDRPYPLWFCFIVAIVSTIGSIGLSANSEAVFVLLEMVSVYYAAKPNVSFKDITISAIVCAAAINTSYVTISCLFPALVYAVSLRSRDTRQFVFWSAAYVAILCAVTVFILVLMASFGANVERYFVWQLGFLSSYAEVRRFPSIDVILRLVVMLGVASIAFRRVGTGAEAEAPGVGIDRAFGFLILGGFLSLLLSGKYFPHYLYLLGGPGAVVLLRYLQTARAASTWRFVPWAAAMCFVLSMGTSLISRGNYDRVAFEAPYRKLHDIVGRTPVMAMRVGIAPQYFAQVTPFQPFIMWDNPPGSVFKPVEDRYYTGQVSRGPAFVLTAPGFCHGDGAGSAACAALTRDYRRRLDFAGEAPNFSHNRQQVGYVLYQRTVSAPAPLGAGGLNSLSPAPM